MSLGFYEGAGHVLPDGTRAEKKRRPEQWDDSQRRQQAQRASIDDKPDRFQPLTASRKRADSHQPTPSTPLRQSIDASPTKYPSVQCRSSYDYEQPRRYSSVDNNYIGNRLWPQQSPLYPEGELRRLSGNFNAPTQVELERQREHRKSLKGVEKLRSKLKGLVRT